MTARSSLRRVRFHSGRQKDCRWRGFIALTLILGVVLCEPACRRRPVANGPAESAAKPASDKAPSEHVPEASPTSTDELPATTNADSALNEGPSNAADTTGTTGNDSASGSAEADAPIATEKPGTGPHSWPAGERIVLLAPGGPLLIDLELTIDGRPPEAVMRDMVRQALELADIDGDGTATWDEITKESVLRYGEFGNLTAQNESDRLRIVELYDVNRNGVAEEDELRRYATRNAGASKAFHLRGSNLYRDTNRWDSPLRKLLDRNADGRFDAGEREAAAQALKSRDADDDDTLTAADFNVSDEGMVSPLSQRRATEADSAFALADIQDWSQFLFALEEVYALRQALRRSSFRDDPLLFDELDTNEDGMIDNDEVQAMHSISPHAVIRMRFGEREGGDGELPRLEVVGVPRPRAGRSMPEWIVRESSMTCWWPDAVVTFFMRDRIPTDYEQEGARQLAAFDADNNGYLEESEVPEPVRAAWGGFDYADADGDGKLIVSELARVLEQRQAFMRSQLRCRAGEDRDALFTVLDRNADGRLTAREIRQVSGRLAEFDFDGDGLVDLREIPTAMLVGVVRADPVEDDSLFTPPTSSAPARGAPAWFLSMDENGDGDIARREFLGRMETFDALDQDGDGLLSVDEATR